MKKFTAGALVCLLLAAMATQIGATESTNVLEIPYVADGTITIDGKMDDAYALCAVQNIAEQDLYYLPDNPQNASGQFWACYDSSYLYLFVEVADANIDYSNTDTSAVTSREAIGIMLDFDYNRSENYAYSYANNKDRVGYLNLSGDGYTVSYHIYASDLDGADPYYGLYDLITFDTVSDTKDGRILYEVALPFPEDMTLDAGTKFGMEILVNNAEGGARVGEATWSAGGYEMWQWSDVCGTAILGAPVVAEPEVTAEEETVSDVVVETTTAPATADAGVTATVAAIVAAAGYAAAKKRK